MMEKLQSIKLFESKQIRSLWNNDEEKWYFSIIDVIELLTETDRPRKYWSDLKAKLIKEGSELSEKIGQLKNLKKENLRDHMTNLELVLNMLAEATTTEISKKKLPKTFEQSKIIARQ
jgi:hypothetical protein